MARTEVKMENNENETSEENGIKDATLAYEVEDDDDLEYKTVCIQVQKVYAKDQSFEDENGFSIEELQK